MNEKSELTEEEAKALGYSVEPQTESEEIEQSYIQADGHFWNETRLDPYSAQRQIAAQAMGMRFGSLSAEDLEDAGKLATYPGMMQDAVIVLYLCYPRGKNGKEGIEESYAACDPIARRGVRRRMLDWAASQGIEIGSEPYQKAVEIMLALIREAKVNHFKPQSASGIKPSGN